jgi:leader peptidase (prepilin peptidase)/N-methyltransferase
VNDTVLAAVLGALVAGLGGLLVPMLIARVPEPPPKQAPAPEADVEPADVEPDVAPEPPKMLYAVIAARPGLATGERETLVRALLAMVLVRSFFWLLWRIHAAGMGFGDVRLAALVGLALGWLGWGVVAIGVWVGFVVFALPGLVLAIARRDRALLRKPFPYGPFMVLGALVGLVWGTRLAGRIWG